MQNQNALDKSVLWQLEKSGVVSFTLSDDKLGLTVIEQCDQNYGVNLDSLAVFNLIQELTALYNQMCKIEPNEQ